MPEPLVELVSVSKDYASGAGVVNALGNVSLTIHEGEFVAIVGASGSGKSTLMNIIGCLDRPTRGTYRLADVDVGHRSNDGRALVRNRLIGFIFQGFNLLPRTTALENCELPLQYRGHPAAVRRRRALRALDQVGLGDRTHHTPNQLSGGQQQRVAIARALVTDPPLLLADEPTGNLDTRTSLEVLALLQKLNRERGLTIVLVTHERDIAACASRIITMRDGRIVSDTLHAEPLDAALALEALPPPQTSAAGLEAALGPREQLRERLGGPIPLAVYAAMFGGGALGALAGTAYNGLVLGQSVPAIVALAMIAAETCVGARYGAMREAGALTFDQRGRIALVYTCAVSLPIGALWVWFFVNKLPGSLLESIEHLSAGGVALALASSLLALAAIALLRYLLLTLFAPRAHATHRSVTRESP